MPYFAFTFCRFSLDIPMSAAKPAIKPNIIRLNVSVTPAKSKTVAVDNAAKAAVISEPANSL